MADTKWCTGCQAPHERDDFVRDRSRADGLRSYCRAYRRAQHALNHPRTRIDSLARHDRPAAEPLTLAYLAGLIDADGYITIPRNRATLASGERRSYYVAQVGLGQVTEDGPRLLYDTFGGYITYYTPPNPKHVPRWVWHATNTLAARAARDLRPYLRLKARQADLVLAFARRLDDNRGARVSLDEEAAREALFDEIRALNSPKGGGLARQRKLGGSRPGTALEDLPEDLRIREYPAARP